MLTTARLVMFSQHRVHTGPILDSFGSVSDDEVLQLINKLPSKSSSCDILPVSLLKCCADVFGSVVARIVNLLSERCFPTPSGFKIAQVSLLLKKLELDCTDPANYQLISNLLTVSKLVEHLVLVRLRPHLLASANFNPLHLAYRTGHSTESTNLIKILDDFYAGINNKQLTILVSLDISVAFVTICHPKLLQRLCDDFEVCGTTLNWIDSYVSNRQQFVKTGQYLAPTTYCTSGVLQGSVLRPLLFAAYMSPFADVKSTHGMLFHQYADDTQLYVAAKAKVDTADALKTVSSCTYAVQSWFLLNDVLLNPDKSEVVVIGTQTQIKAYPCGDHVDDARVVLQMPRRSHADDLLAQLHWLPVSYRIKYKIV